MPIFEDATCPDNTGDLCIAVFFPNSVEDMVILSQVSGTSIYEGYLLDDNEVPVVMIDIPLNKDRMVIIIN